MNWARSSRDKNCIYYFSGMNGYNNNPDVIQFRASLKKLLVKNSIQASQNGNCLEFEPDANCSIFDLKGKKNSSPAVEASNQGDPDLDVLCHQIEGYNLSEFQDAIVGYIAGIYYLHITFP